MTGRQRLSPTSRRGASQPSIRRSPPNGIRIETGTLPLRTSPLNHSYACGGFVDDAAENGPHRLERGHVSKQVAAEVALDDSTDPQGAPQRQGQGRRSQTCSPTLHVSGTKHATKTSLPQWSGRRAKFTAWWQCAKCSHVWRTTPYHRTARAQGCKRCNSGRSNAIPKPGNSLLERFPDIASDWHPTKEWSPLPAGCHACFKKEGVVAV